MGNKQTRDEQEDERKLREHLKKVTAPIYQYFTSELETRVRWKKN
jgi:hypothetical protein